MYAGVPLQIIFVRGNMTQKEKIDYIIKEYEKGNYITRDFCELFEEYVYHEKDGTVSEEELIILREHGDVFCRYSPYEEDVKSGFLFDEDRVKAELENLKMVLK